MVDFFARLPAGRLTPLEEELRGLLHNTAAAAAKLLPRSGGISLQEWVERRMPREIVLGTNAQGKVKIAPLSKESQVNGAGAPAAQQSSREYFDSLPADEFTEEEERLRDALLGVLNKGQLYTASKLLRDENVVHAKGFLPRSVYLEEWIENRIGADVTIKVDHDGNKTYKLRGPSKEEKEELTDKFFQSLPRGSFTEAEDRLRQALHAFLANTPSHLHHLSAAGSDPGIRGPRREVLETPELRINLKEWIEQRIGGEIEVHKDEKSNQYMLRIAGRGGAVPRKGEKGEKGGKGVLRKGEKGEKSGKGKDQLSEEDHETMTERIEEQREQFFARLPADAFSELERELREALFAFIENFPGPGWPSLSAIGGDERIKVARKAFLPRETHVSLRQWIDRRIGGEIETSIVGGSSEVYIGLRNGSKKGKEGKEGKGKKGGKAGAQKGPAHEDQGKGKGKKK